MPPKGARKAKAVAVRKENLKQKLGLKVRSTEGREEAKAAAKMTKEQWKKYQTEEYKKKWPKPDYMANYKNSFVRDGGEGAYRDQTYALVTRWMAETKISYRPHAKSPGSKSHIRYETYSKATTVAQALKMGSWPLDWCYDYEHGFIKVHGPLRDEPLDSTQHNGALTPVDEAICAWHRKELAKRHGLNLRDLYVDKGAGESVMMRVHRLVADRKAKELIDKNKGITDEDVQEVMTAWAFAKNTARVNVMPDGENYVWSDTVGLLRDRIGDIHLTQSATRYPNFTRIFIKWLAERLPEEAKSFKFTSLNLNCNYAARRHRDGNNFGPSMIKAFGAFKGGKLAVFPRDNREITDLAKLPARDRQVIDIKKNLVMFNGNSAHEVDDFHGSRFSVVYFTLGCHAKAKDDIRATMANIGFPVPAKDEDPRALLPAPSGYNTKTTAGCVKAWPVAKLTKKKHAFAKLKTIKTFSRAGTQAKEKRKAAMERAEASNRWRIR